MFTLLVEFYLLTCKVVNENISKAHRTYFALGAIGAFKGLQDPLSGHNTCLTFVLPILVATTGYSQSHCLWSWRVLNWNWQAGCCTSQTPCWSKCITLPLNQSAYYPFEVPGKVTLFHQRWHKFLSLWHLMIYIHRISLVEQCQFLESEFGTSFTD